ncbi:hypothetical protein [Pedobacter sp. ASV28]|uniref:hypothetical protein n=1 Tax=Pedobacter sp. ASV28 TaxID=2795123 RepID=UPI0018ED0652|nr:hypothetical protein [Pedobacter sp. ASV28]
MDHKQHRNQEEGDFYGPLLQGKEKFSMDDSNSRKGENMNTIINVDIDKSLVPVKLYIKSTIKKSRIGRNMLSTKSKRNPSWNVVDFETDELT